MSKIIRKLTIKSVVGSKVEILRIAMLGRKNNESEGEPVPMLMILGRVSGMKAGESDFGSFAKLQGEFEATNLQTGEVTSECSQAILPGFIGDSIASAIKNGAQSVDFGVKISVAFNETAATMYEFRAESLMPQQTANSVIEIKARLTASGVALPQIAAPTQAPLALAPAPAPAIATPPETQPEHAKRKR